MPAGPSRSLIEGSCKSRSKREDKRTLGAEADGKALLLLSLLLLLFAAS
jgi:hypothetical protein